MSSVADEDSGGGGSDHVPSQHHALIPNPIPNFHAVKEICGDRKGVLVNYGKDYGQLVVIVDVIDQNRALVDALDMVRTQMNFKRLSLADIKIDIERVPKKTTLIAVMEVGDEE